MTTELEKVCERLKISAACKYGAVELPDDCGNMGAAPVVTIASKKSA